MDNIKFAAFQNIVELEPKTLPKRKRSMTVINLQWHADRARKAKRIKNLIDAKIYHVPSTLVAKAIFR